MSVSPLRRVLLRQAKCAFTTRRVPPSDMRTVLTGDLKPRSGDLLIAIVDELGSHQRIELPNGRRARLVPGDLVIVCYGNRYAPDQFEAFVSRDLGPCDLIAAGGIAGREQCRHERMSAPTRLLPIGLVGDANGEVLNIARYRVRTTKPQRRISVVAVFGTAMNSGKTMTAGSLISGLARADYRVAGIKATGTGSGGDLWLMADMGASYCADFTDAGMASTYLAKPEAIEDGVLSLIDLAASEGCNVAVIEIADGLQHEETAMLMHSAGLRERISGVVFAAYDALGAKAGVETMSVHRHRIFGVSGQITRSPLAIRETRAATGIEVFSPHELQLGALNPTIMSGNNGLSLNGAARKKAIGTSSRSRQETTIEALIAEQQRKSREAPRFGHVNGTHSLGHNGPPVPIETDSFFDPYEPR